MSISGVITIDLTNYPETLKVLRSGPEVVASELTRSVTTLALKGQSISMTKAPKDKGDLRRSIYYKAGRFAGGEAVASWGTRIKHGAVMESGRGAGKPMPPRGALLGWMRRHGIDAKREFVIRRSIGKKGIKGRWYLRDARTELLPAVDAEAKAMLARIVQRIAAEGAA